MTRIILRGLSVAAVGALLPLSALADGSFYLKALGGASDLQGSSVTLGPVTGDGRFDTGFIVGGALGYDYAGSPFRAEVEYTYRTADASSLPGGIGTGGDFASTTLMLNGFYSFATTGRWTPYVGLGIGAMTEVDFDVSGGGEFSDRSVFAAQLMVGAEYEISERATFFGELRYFDAGEVDMTGAGGSLRADYRTVDLVAGISFSF
ncbi:MAG: outer membrane protein [Arenibacterium sp.]